VERRCHKDSCIAGKRFTAKHFLGLCFVEKFKDYFSEGFKAFIVVVLLMVIYTFIFVKINPQIIGNFVEENNKLLAAEGNRTQAEILDNATKIKSLFLLTMVMGATITYLFIGALVSLVMAGFLSQKNVSAS